MLLRALIYIVCVVIAFCVVVLIAAADTSRESPRVPRRRA
jgi:hypothetical protein